MHLHEPRLIISGVDGGDELRGSEPVPAKRLHPTIIATGWVSFFTDLGSELIYPLLPLFLTIDLGATRAIVGLIEGLAEGTPQLLRWLSGAWADRVRNRKWLIFLGYAVSSLAKPFIGLSHLASQVLCLRVIDRCGKGIRTAPRDALVGDLAAPRRRGFAFGFQRAMDHLGAMGGGLLAFVLVGVIGLTLKWAIFASIIPGVCTLFIILIFVRERADRRPVKSTAREAFTWRGFPRAYYFFLGSAVIFALANSSDAFLLLRSHELGTAVALVPLLWASLHVVKAATSLWGGRLSDRWGRKPVLIGGWLLYALVYVGFAVMKGAWVPWLLFALYGCFFGATEGTARAFIADLVDSRRRGAAFGILGALEGILLIPASILTGWLWDLTGSAAVPLILCGALSALAALWLSLAISSPATQR